jgi:hypothetical protein
MHLLEYSPTRESARNRCCLVVLSALNANDANEQVCQELRQRRAQSAATLRQRLKRAVREGELPKSVDCEAVATFYITVQHGMSIQARDGVSREALLTVAASAMAAWDELASPTQWCRRRLLTFARATCTW